MGCLVSQSARLLQGLLPTKPLVEQLLQWALVQGRCGGRLIKHGLLQALLGLQSTPGQVADLIGKAVPALLLRALLEALLLEPKLRFDKGLPQLPYIL